MRNTNQNLLDNIVSEIEKNPKVTEAFLGEKYLCHERTIRRYIKKLKDNNKVKLIGSGHSRQWIIISTNKK